jgi:hypothetical protein
MRCNRQSFRFAIALLHLRHWRWLNYRIERTIE